MPENSCEICDASARLSAIPIDGKQQVHRRTPGWSFLVGRKISSEFRVEPEPSREGLNKNVLMTSQKSEPCELRMLYGDMDGRGK